MLNTNSQIEYTKNTQSSRLRMKDKQPAIKEKATEAIAANLVLFAENEKKVKMLGCT